MNMSDFNLYRISQDFGNLIDLIDRDVLEPLEVEEIKLRLSNAIVSQGQDITKFYINEKADIETLNRKLKDFK